MKVYVQRIKLLMLIIIGFFCINTSQQRKGLHSSYTSQNKELYHLQIVRIICSKIDCQTTVIAHTHMEFDFSKFPSGLLCLDYLTHLNLTFACTYTSCISHPEFRLDLSKRLQMCHNVPDKEYIVIWRVFRLPVLPSKRTLSVDLARREDFYALLQARYKAELDRVLGSSFFKSI